MTARGALALGAMVALCGLAGLAGGWAGVRLGRAGVSAPVSLHRLVHHDLKLDGGQSTHMQALELDFAARRARLEADMRAANADLAAAITQDHADTPRVQAAVDRFHVAMGALQKATVAHVLAMRAVLRPDQTPRFDREVSEALTSDRR